MGVEGARGVRQGAASPTLSIRYGDGSVRQLPLAEVRLAAFTDSVPWRIVRSVHGQPHYAGSYASATTGGHVVYESRLELARLLLADFDASVVRILAQPCWLRAPIAGRVRHHVPDFLLVMRSGTVRVANVKPLHRLSDEKVRDALAWPGELCGRLGWEYEVWSGTDAALLENVRFLAAYRRPGVAPTADVEAAWTSVRDGVPLAVAERELAGARPRYEVRPALMALLWSGRLTTDLTCPLGGDSVLWKAR